MRSAWSRFAKAVPRWVLSSLVDAVYLELWLVAALVGAGNAAWPSALPSLAYLIFVGCAAQYAAWRYGRTRAVPAAIQVGWGLTLTLGAYLLTYLTWTQHTGVAGLFDWNPALLALPATYVQWVLQAGRKDRSSAGTLEMRTRYAWSLPVYLLAAWLMGVGDAAGAPGEVGVLLGLGFVVALLEFGLLSHWENAERLQRSGESDLAHTSWGVPAAVLVGGLGIGLAEVLPSGNHSVTGWLVGLVGYILYWPVMLLSRVLLWLFEPLLRYLMARGRAQSLQQMKQAVDAAQNRALFSGPAGPGYHMPLWLRVLLIVAVVAVVVLILMRVRSRTDGVANELLEERQSLGFEHLWRDLRRGAQRQQPDDPPPAHAEAARLYRRLQTWSARQGVPRRPGQTPAAHAAEVQAAYPAAARAIGRVQTLYERFRYSPTAPHDPEVAAAADAMRELEGSSFNRAAFHENG